MSIRAVEDFLTDYPDHSNKFDTFEEIKSAYDKAIETLEEVKKTMSDNLKVWNNIASIGKDLQEKINNLDYEISMYTDI